MTNSRNTPHPAAPVLAGTTPHPATCVLFVCLGNICRSPTAESVFRSEVERAGLADTIRIDSAGIGDWHTGRAPDRRAIAAARRRGYDLTCLRARQVDPGDFARFDWILAMDRSNLRALKQMQPPDFDGHLGLFLDFAPETGLRDVPDPYDAGADRFEQVLDLVELASRGLLAAVRAHIVQRGCEDNR